MQDVPDGNPNGDSFDQVVEAGNPTITIGDQEIPLYAGNGLSHLVWALWNLILSVAVIVLAAMVAIRVFIRKRNDSQDNVYVETPLILTVPALAIAAIALFLLTQDMRQLMVMVDWWTWIHLGIFIAALLSYMFAFKRTKDEGEDNYGKQDKFRDLHFKLNWEKA